MLISNLGVKGRLVAVVISFGGFVAGLLVGDPLMAGGGILMLIGIALVVAHDK